VEEPTGRFTKFSEASNGKDTMTGHWEMMGIYTTKPFKTFTDHGFPKELIEELEKRTGHKVIGNKSASGTAILDELGEEEIATGHMIVYTSAEFYRSAEMRKHLVSTSCTDAAGSQERLR
jgi:phosphopentomutase